MPALLCLAGDVDQGLGREGRFGYSFIEASQNNHVNPVPRRIYICDFFDVIDKTDIERSLSTALNAFQLSPTMLARLS